MVYGMLWHGRKLHIRLRRRCALGVRSDKSFLGAGTPRAAQRQMRNPVIAGSEGIQILQVLHSTGLRLNKYVITNLSSSLKQQMNYAPDEYTQL